jgi:hypothetical protein
MAVPQVPAGVFLPTIAIGAALGRAVGLLTYGLISPLESIGLTVVCLARACIGRTLKRGCSPPVHPIPQSAAFILAFTLLLAHHRCWRALPG